MLTNNGLTLTYMQRHVYSLDCGHKHQDVVSIAVRPKKRMKCKTCALKATE